MVQDGMGVVSLYFIVIPREPVKSRFVPESILYYVAVVEKAYSYYSIPRVERSAATEYTKLNVFRYRPKRIFNVFKKRGNNIAYSTNKKDTFLVIIIKPAENV